MIEELTWDSVFFGKRIGTLNENDQKGFDPVKADQFDLIQCCCNIKNTDFIGKLEKHGFHYVDTRIDFILNIENYETETYQLADEEDIDSIKAIAAETFKESRYSNSYFNRNDSKRFYSKWAENAVLGKFDDYCLIVKEDGDIKGFITYKQADNKTSTIGLLGISMNNQGKGYGKRLVREYSYFSGLKGNSWINVSTQGTNLNAQIFYIKNGFIPKRIQSWYYYEKK